MLIRRAIGDQRDQFVIATKGGIHFEGDTMTGDARPEVLKQECDESLHRLGTDRVDLYYLHSPDKQTPVDESAGAIAELIEGGKVRTAGICNASLPQIRAFHAVCPLTAVQLPYNMLQRGIERKTIPWCKAQGVAVMVYWALMKGLLAGKLPRDHEFDPADSRRKYPMFQGEQWQRNQDFLDRLRDIAEAQGVSVAQLVVAWTASQAGVTSVLCGAKRPQQIRETAAALDTRLSSQMLQAIDQALADRGEAVTNRNFE